MGKLSDVFKKDSKEKKMSETARSFILSGEDVFESTQILQALKPAQDMIDRHIEGLNILLNRFTADGGSIERADTEGGFEAVYTFDTVILRLRYDGEGESCGMSFDDSSTDGINIEALSRVYDAARALTELPRRTYAKQELERIVDYVQNDNALKGLQRMKDILGNDVNIVYQAATQEPEEHEGSSYPNYEKILEVRGT